MELGFEALVDNVLGVIRSNYGMLVSLEDRRGILPRRARFSLASGSILLVCNRNGQDDGQRRDHRRLLASLDMFVCR